MSLEGLPPELKRLLELAREVEELELENVELSAEDLTLIIQPMVARALAPPKPALPEKLVEARFTPPIEEWSGMVVEVQLGATRSEGGSRGRVVKVGGERTMPFYNFEYKNPNKPAFSMDVFDAPIGLPGVVKQHFKDVMHDPAEWAKRAVEFGADLVSLHLVSTDPLLNDTPASEAAKTVEKVLQAVDVPLIIGGSGNARKDPEVLEKAAEAASGERCLLNAARLDMDYARIVRAAKQHNHLVVSFTPMDINNQKKLNRLLMEAGLDRDRIIMDPTTGALGYGIEYSVSLMERIRLSALLGDEELAMPILAATSNAWGAREAWMKSDELGPREYRGPLWEAVTTLTILLSGADIFMVSHPATVRVMKSLVSSLQGEFESHRSYEEWLVSVRR